MCNKINLCSWWMIESWDLGEWSECSRRCGPGTQHRQVICRQVTHVRANGIETSNVVAPELCGLFDRPLTISTCQLKICSQWEIRSAWTPVRASFPPCSTVHDCWNLLHVHCYMKKHSALYSLFPSLSVQCLVALVSEAGRWCVWATRVMWRTRKSVTWTSSQNHYKTVTWERVRAAGSPPSGASG